MTGLELGFGKRWRFRFRVSSGEKFRDYELFSINKDLQVSQFNKWASRVSQQMH